MMLFLIIIRRQLMDLMTFSLTWAKNYKINYLKAQQQYTITQTKNVPYNFTFFQVSASDLLVLYHKIKPKASQGLDVLSNKIIIILFPSILHILTKLINMSLFNSIVPTHLKTARVITIYKDGTKHSFNNYHPISLISSFGKLLEKIVCTQLLR